MSSGDDEPESGEVVAPVEKFGSELRPSVLSAVRVSAFASDASGQDRTLGQPAVGLRWSRSARQIQVRTSPVYLFHARIGATIKINNYNGTTSAKGEGMALPTTYEQKVSVTRVQTAQVDKVKGGDARGIPPRGRPV